MSKNKLQNDMIGRRYYTYDDENNLKVIRIIKIHNPEKILVYDDNKGIQNQFIISNKELEKYTLLKPDMAYVFNMVAATPYNNNIDVMMYIMKKQDIGRRMPPICFARRQMAIQLQEHNFIQLGGLMLYNENDVSGLKAFLSCDHIVKSVVINGYIDDRKIDIYNLIPKKLLLAMNSQMKNNAEAFKKSAKEKKFYGSIQMPENVKDFFFDDYSEYIDDSIGIFGVININPKNEIETHKAFEELLGHYVTNLDIIEYKKDIDLSLIKTEYKLIRNSNDDKVYLFNFIRGGKIKTEIDSDITKAFSLKN